MARLHFLLATVAACLPSALSQSAYLPWQSLPGSIYSPSTPWADAPDASWPPTFSVGSPITPQSPDDDLLALLSAIDINRVKSIVTTLANFTTRHTLSTQNSTTNGIGAARDWILREMTANAAAAGGDMTVGLNSYIQPVAERISFPVNISNVVAQINGTDDPNRVYVVTGHYDSRCLDIMDYTSPAPGADDDATGVAVVMELARVVAAHHIRPKATMIFAATAGEEQDLYGATHLAQTLKTAGYNVEGNWNNDIVGTGQNTPFAEINDYTIRLFGASIFYPNASTSAVESEVGLTGLWNDSPAQNLGRFIAEIAAGATDAVGMQVALIYRPDRFLRGGDHIAFLEQGFPAVRFTEAVEDFRHQHQDPRVQNSTQYGDLLEYVDFEYTTRVARTNLASMWSAANAPAMPRNVTISEIVGFPAADRNTPLEEISNDSKFCWEIGNDDLVQGYELVWRVSGNLQWSHVLTVEKGAGSVTVNLPKDDLQFGVRAVGEGERRSPAVAPVPGEEC